MRAAGGEANRSPSSAPSGGLATSRGPPLILQSSRTSLLLCTLLAADKNLVRRQTEHCRAQKRMMICKGGVQTRDVAYRDIGIADTDMNSYYSHRWGTARDASESDADGQNDSARDT